MFNKILKWFGVLLLAMVAYLLLWPVPIDPVSWTPPENAGYTGDFSPNNKLGQLKFINLDGRYGPEDVALGGDGKLYAAMHDGSILRINLQNLKVEEFVNTGGRPLGVEFGSDGVLYVADSYRGLLAIDPKGQIKLLADKSADGSLINYADDLDVTKKGVVYFSDASTKFGARQSKGTLEGSLLDLMEHGPNGRILKYDPDTGETTIVLEGRSFANGVALGPNDAYFLFAETGTYDVHKFWLKGEKAGTMETIVQNLPGFPDNINDNGDGTFWLGLVSPRSAPMDRLSDKPFVRKIVQRLPAFIRPKPQRYGFIVRIDGDGKVLETMQDPKGIYALTTGALDGPDGSVFVTSLSEPRLGVWRKQ